MDMTKREGAIITAYTGIMCCEFDSFHIYAEEIMRRPVLTHEFANEKVSKMIKERSKDDFMKVVKNQSE